MNIENLNDLKETLYRKGFGDSLNGELEKNMKSAAPEFTLRYEAKVEGDEIAYRLHFRNDAEKDKVYFNKYDVELTLSGATEPLTHTFIANQLITAMEAYRMLKFGDLVAVNKTLFNKDSEQYNTWLSVNTKGEKDEYGNYPVNSFHENYYKKQAFDVKTELGKIDVPVKQLENPANLESFEKSLKKANLIPVDIMLGGSETKAFLGVNPVKGTVVLYDTSLELINTNGQQQSEAEHKDNAVKNEATPQNEGVKKKSWDNRQVNWQEKKQSKGQGI